jgi:hypothetical protein
MAQIEGSRGKVPNAYGSNKNNNLTYSDLGNGINSSVAMNQLNQNRLIYNRDKGKQVYFDQNPSLQIPGNI